MKKRKTIYSTKLGKRTDAFAINADAVFAIGTDTTDHFSFVCEKCGWAAKVERIDLWSEPAELYIWLSCKNPDCGVVGKRKHYLDLENANEYQFAFSIGTKKIYSFGHGDKPLETYNCILKKIKRVKNVLAIGDNSVSKSELQRSNKPAKDE